MKLPSKPPKAPYQPVSRAARAISLLFQCLDKGLVNVPKNQLVTDPNLIMFKAVLSSRENALRIMDKSPELQKVLDDWLAECQLL